MARWGMSWEFHGRGRLVRDRQPRITTLWRAALRDAPYFGRGSHWTTSEDSARGFQRWLEETSSVRRLIYRAEVQLTGVFEAPSRVLLDPSEVTKCVAWAWPEGYQWLAFYEAGAWDTRLAKQYVYLGHEPVTAAQA
jgi:hypothetical protein